jgi:hypothetical protein
MELDRLKEKNEREEMMERINLSSSVMNLHGLERERERERETNILSQLLLFVLRTKNFINFVRLVWCMSFAVGIWKCRVSSGSSNPQASY